MLRYPKNLVGLDTIVNYSASLIRIPVCDIIVHLPLNYYVHVLATHRRLYSYSASLVSIIIHVYAVNLRIINFYSEFYGKQDVCANGVYQALSPPPQRAWGQG